jgi:hypothetical protein
MSASRVGPVLQAGEVAQAILAAACAENAGVEAIDRGSYLRLSAPRRCCVSRAAIEAALGRPFRLPGDLERVMASFAGRFQVDEDRACWIAPEGGGE